VLIEIAAEGPHRGADDPAVVDRAAARGGVLVSHNQRDRLRFRAHVRTWRLRGNDTLCVLLLPRDADDDRLMLRTLLLLDWYAAHPLPKPQTAIWNDVAQALIRGDRLPGYSAADVRYALGNAVRDRPDNSAHQRSG
jgi:hypothetical protein